MHDIFYCRQFPVFRILLVFFFLFVPLGTYAQKPNIEISNLGFSPSFYRNGNQRLLDTVRISFGITRPDQISNIKIYVGNVSATQCEIEELQAEIWYNNRLSKYVVSNFEAFEKSIYTTVNNNKISVPVLIRQMDKQWKNVNYLLVVVVDDYKNTYYQHYGNSRELVDKLCK